MTDVRPGLRILLGLFLASAGISHLTWSRTEFLAQVPRWLPIDADFIVVSSGVVEILLGIGLIFFAKHALLMGKINALFFIAIFPGNINQYIHQIDAFGLNTDSARFIRLFFQPLLVL